MNKELLKYKKKVFNRMKGKYEIITVDNNFKMPESGTDTKHWKPNISTLAELGKINAPIDPSCYMFTDGVDNGLRNYIARDPASDIVDLVKEQKRLEKEQEELGKDYSEEVADGITAINNVVAKAKAGKATIKDSGEKSE